MEPEPTVLDSLRKAVEAMPDDVPLRLHLAAAMLLQSRASGTSGQADRRRAAARPGQRPCARPAADPVRRLRRPANRRLIPRSFLPNGPGCLPRRPLGASRPDGEPGPSAGKPGQASHYDWSQAEDELRDVLPAMFVGDGGCAGGFRLGGHRGGGSVRR